jgi:hypothetical protein
MGQYRMLRDNSVAIRNKIVMSELKYFPMVTNYIEDHIFPESSYIFIWIGMISLHTKTPHTKVPATPQGRAMFSDEPGRHGRLATRRDAADRRPV